MSLIPNDVLVEIALTCWRAYKAIFLVNKTVYDKLHEVRVKEVFYAERQEREFEGEEHEYYKYVLMNLPRECTIKIYINGFNIREYGLCYYTNRRDDITKLNYLYRFRKHDGYVYKEETWYTNHNKVFVIRSRKKRQYVVTHSITLEISQDGYYNKYTPSEPDPDGYIDTNWLIHLPGFFHYEFDDTENNNMNTDT
jgi:hypothetical protein